MDKEKHLVRKIKLITSAITTYLFLSILIMITWTALDPPQPATALSFTLAGSSTWAIGTKGASQASTSPTSPTTWTVTNDSSPAVTESITIQVTGVTWTSAASAWTTAGTGSNVYVLTLKSPGDNIMGTTATTLATGLAGGGTKGFGLAFTTPSASTEQGAHTLTITLTAVAYTMPCAGWYSYGHCWYTQQVVESCSTTCNNLSKTCVPTAISGSDEQGVCQHFRPASTMTLWPIGYEVNPAEAGSSGAFTCYDNYGASKASVCSRVHPADLPRFCACDS